MNEKKAIELCLKYHDPIGFEFLVKKFKEEAFYHAYSFIGNSEDAADICQESFSKAFNAIPRLKQLQKFYPWFYTILRNASLNFLKKQKIVRKKQYETVNNLTPIIVSPEENLEKSEKNRKIWEILFMLKPEFREILVLKYAEDMNYKDLSTILGIPRGTVMSRLYNARKSFKKIYLKEEKYAG